MTWLEGDILSPTTLNARFNSGVSELDSLVIQNVLTPTRGISLYRYAAADSDTNKGTTFRGIVLGGTQASPTSTQAGQAVAFSFHCTPNGTSTAGQAELVMSATENHDQDNRGTQAILSTTLSGTSTRAGTWILSDGAGNLRPFKNDTYDIGNDGGTRVRRLYVSRLVKVGSTESSQPGVVQLDGLAATTREIYFSSSGSRRWQIRTNTAEESGSDAGCGLFIRAYADDGSTIDDALNITRAAGGNITSNRPISILSTGTGLLVDNQYVVKSRIAGWATWGGTANRSTFTTSSATLGDVAQTLKALIDDLKTHGLIGT